MAEKPESVGQKHLTSVSKMHLHLHLGLHKTATSHLQTLLQSTCERFAQHTHYMPNDFSRHHITGAEARKNPEMAYEYFHSLRSHDTQNIIVSEENICGHSYSFFRTKRLYGELRQRLHNLAFLNDMFESMDIWVSIRDQATFFPSLYCEALRWGKFQGFNKILDGNLQQSWVPVIQTMSSVFPKARVRVLQYENYHDNLPDFFEALTAHPFDADMSSRNTVNRSLNALSVRLAANCDWFLPGMVSSRVVTRLNALTADYSQAKFSPFSPQQRDRLSNLYKQDKAKLALDPQVELFGRGW
jgi:hypothetical protein